MLSARRAMGGGGKMTEKECKHESYEIKQVMDFQFCVCRNCGFQWKGNKPYKEKEEILKHD